MKKCAKCQEIKTKDNFCSNKRKKDGLNYYCKICVSFINATYKKEWRRNGGSIKEKESLYSDPLRLMKKKLRSLINNTINGGGYRKNTKTFVILGAEFNVVKKHIEEKFKDGMTWENHGAWHIDHIIPASFAKNENDLLKLNHYSNLQPLWAKENLQKGAKLDDRIEHL